MKKTKKLIITTILTTLCLTGCVSSNTTHKVKEKTICYLNQTTKAADYEENKLVIEQTQKTIQEINKTSKNAIKNYEYSEKTHEETMEKAFNEKCETILGIGKTSSELMFYYAASHPETNFISIGEQFPNKLTNTKSIIFNELESGFLAGYLSAGMTRTGKIATFSDTDKDALNTYINGISDGVAKYNADNGTAIEVVGIGTNKTDIKDKKPASIEKLVDELLAQKADIFVPELEQNQNKVLEKIAKVQNTNIIWGGKNLPKNKDLLKKILANTNVSFETLLKETIVESQKDKFSNKTIQTTLKNKSLQFLVNKEIEKDIPETLRKKLKEIENKLIKGELSIYADK